MNFFKFDYKIVLLCVTIAIFSAMAFSTLEFETTPMPSDVIGVVVSPFQLLITGVNNAIRSVFSDINSLFAAKDKNIEYLERIDDLERDTRETQEIRRENAEFRELLDLKARMIEYETTGAMIVSKDVSNFFHTFVIDKGSADGIAKNNVVVSSKGVVGHVYEVGTTWSKVITLIDPKFGVSALLARTAELGVVEGDLALGKEGKCKLNFIDKTSSIIVGDYVETAGVGGIYPRGLLIGRVEGVYPDSQGLSNYAIVQTAVDFNDITAVLIIKQSPTSEP